MTGQEFHTGPEPDERTCTVCGEPVILAYMGFNSDPVDTLHAIRIGEHDHDAVTNMDDLEDARYGQPPAGWAD